MKLESPNDKDDNPCRPRHFKPSLVAQRPRDAPENKTLEISRKRLVLIGMVFVAAFLVITGRLTQVTLFKEADAQTTRITQTAIVSSVDYGRADIVDRNGDVIATTLQSYSLSANPRLIADKEGVARTLAKSMPGQDQAGIEEKLSKDTGFVWLARHLTPSQEFDISALGLKGIELQREDKRIYPAGPLAAHVAGYTDLDGRGLAGIERSFDTTLNSAHEPLKLSIDLRLQAILREEMQKSIDTFSAIGSSGIVMDVRTGEILSLVSLPDFDPNDMHALIRDRGVTNKDGNDPRFNRATLGTYEMGSVFKIFNTALGLDGGKVTLDSTFNIAPIHYGRFTIHDDRGEDLSGPQTVSTIFMKSSNIGSAKMVLESGPEAQRAFLGKLGLLTPAAVEIPEIGAPSVPNPWRELNEMTIAFGHGLSVSQIQTAIAASAIVNGGILRPATFIKHEDGYMPAGTRVISEKTSDQMRKLLRLVVTNGTGSSAEVPGYLVGGKTGTAEKAGQHGYQKKALLSSFVGVFPMNAPRYMVYITIDEPHGIKQTGYYATGHWTAAPTVQRIIARMAPLYGVKPVIETPEIHQAVSLDVAGLSKKNLVEVN